MTPGQNLEPEHMARHPLGRVPAINDDGFVVYETQAILRYLDAVGSRPSLTPTDPKAAARMNQVIGVVDSYYFTRLAAAPLVYHRIIAPRSGMAANEEAVAAVIPATRNVVGVLSSFLNNGPYMSGENFSLADIHAGAHLDMLSASPDGGQMIAATADRLLAGASPHSPQLCRDHLG